ncbi:MAG: PAS domain-containing protein [Methanoregula sp.]|jgi:HAMP domain-containing protein/signal transduction histidine kinase|nr:PAS domain-containing protein [Methanoregula sp.]
MGEKNNHAPQGHSFSQFILLCMVVLVLCVVAFLTVSDYLYTKNNFDREEHLLQIQTEQNIEEAIRFKDALWNTYDASLNQQMRQGLGLVSDEYERAGGDPARMDLTAVKTRMGDDIDIYIIDESGVIIYTTYAPELGMDFKTIPSFYKYLSRIRTADGFFPDRIVNELMGEGKFRKYAYQPTVDHKYILELGLTGQTFENVNEKILVNDNIDTIVAVNPYIEGYRIFNMLGRQSEDNRQPEPAVQEILMDVIITRSTVEVHDQEHSLTRRYLYIDLEDETYGSDPSRIVEVTYSEDLIQEYLNQLLLYHLLTGAAAILIGCIIAFFLSRWITRPVQEIVSDIEIISHGDLDHRIRPTENREFTLLENSINTMVDSLRQALLKMQDDEIFKKEMIDQLPVGVFIKRVDSGHYIFWNRTCERMFAMPAAMILGKTDRDVFPAAVASEIENEDLQIIRNPRKVKSKVEDSRLPGGGVIHMITVPILDSNGTLQFIVGICEDVSHANINLKMDLLFSLTRHDILDNLSVIMNHLERAQLIDTHDEMQTFFEKTIGSISSIRNQISSMRALQDMGLVSPAWQSVQKVMDDALGLLPLHQVTIQLDIDGVEIYADPLLPRVFSLLLENSFKSGGSALSIIMMSAQIRGDTLHIIYQDDSMGVPDTDKENIFEIGYSGTTLRGLFLIRELLGYTGIIIREIGIFGKGAIFDILVPRDKFRKK